MRIRETQLSLFWRNHIEAQSQSSLNIVDYARANNLSPTIFYDRRTKYFRKQAKVNGSSDTVDPNGKVSNFVEAKVVSKATDLSQSFGIQINNDTSGNTVTVTIFDCGKSRAKRIVETLLGML